MIQGSPEWHEHRKRFLNASEAGAVTYTAPYSPATPYALWRVRSGLDAIKTNPAMSRGTQYEPDARAAAEDALGVSLPPAVMTRDQYSASLDGISADGSVVLEIKIPWMGKDSPLWTGLQDGDIPPHYMYQMAQQWFCSRCEMVVFFLYCPETGDSAYTRLRAEELAPLWDELKKAWDVYESLIPEYEANEEVAPAILSAGDQWLELRRQIEQLEHEADIQREILMSAIDEKRTIHLARGAITGQWINRQGSVNYKRVPELKGVDLEPYRNEGTRYFKLSIEENDE